MSTLDYDCIDAEEDHCLCLTDLSVGVCCHCGTTAEELRVEPDPPPVVLCSRCDGLRPWVSILGPCSGCGGSGIEGMTAREAYLREFPPAKP